MLPRPECHLAGPTLSRSHWRDRNRPHQTGWDSERGIIIGITDELKIPIRYIGVGEGMDDLREFNASEFVQALF